MKVREGNLVHSRSNVIFDVKGLVHPPQKVIAFPRFIPATSGHRKSGNVIYRKIYALSKRFDFLKNHYPQYVIYDPVFDETLCEVPVEDLDAIYRPVERLQELRQDKELDEVEQCVLEFFEQVRESSGVSWDRMGISGSILARMHTAESDIDPIVYGMEDCHKVYRTLRSEQKRAKTLRPYTAEELLRLYSFRFQDTRVPQEDFLRTESRKATQGIFKGRDYFLRLVKDWSEVKEEYGSVQYRNLGYARIEAEVIDDSEAIFTPCSYQIANARVVEGPRLPGIERIVSFRGRFCEQARTGEIVIAQGKVEQVTDRMQDLHSLRLLLGNRPSDFMILA